MSSLTTVLKCHPSPAHLSLCVCVCVYIFVFVLFPITKMEAQRRLEFMTLWLLLHLQAKDSVQQVRSISQAEWHFWGRSATVAGMQAAPAWFLRNQGPLVHSMLFSKAKPSSKVSHLHKLNSAISEEPPGQPTEAVNNCKGLSTILFVSVALLRSLSAYHHTFHREILPYGFISSYWNPQTRSRLIFSLLHCSGTSNGPLDWCLLHVHYSHHCSSQNFHCSRKHISSRHVHFCPRAYLKTAFLWSGELH